MQQIGLFGFGCVGQGLHDVLHQSSGFRAEIRKICIHDASKKRRLPISLFTTDRTEVLEDQNINLIVELIDDAEAAWDITKRALRNGKSVVSANKKMIAHHLEELVQLQEQHGAAMLYEGAVCGSIPILRNLEEYYDNDTLHGISGIFNGSTNYILSKIFNENSDYATALREAQELGFAESNPWLDVAGYDAKYKLVIAAAHAFGLFLPPEDVLNLGIEHLSTADVAFARAHNCVVRLVAEARRSSPGNVTLSVLPRFIPKDHLLHHVEYENNAVILETAFSQQQLFMGKGAGGHPTGAAVLSDISARQYQYKYEYKKRNQATQYTTDQDQSILVYLRSENPQLAGALGMKNFRQLGNATLGYTTTAKLLQAKSILEKEACFVADASLLDPGGLKTWKAWESAPKAVEV
ncbi:MAG: homoserine dehydrogenase [Lewinellaceae bacterium]|nr:homoserine dehydrogenase [Lewinellaceae bacterium]